jgi:hypothetical protein
MLSNNAAFDSRVVSRAVIRLLEISNVLYEHWDDPQQVDCRLSKDFISRGPTQFLINLIDVCLGKERSEARDVCIAYALNTLHCRQERLPTPIYGKLLEVYYRPDFQFRVDERRAVTIQDFSESEGHQKQGTQVKTMEHGKAMTQKQA